jgi:DNA-binding MarR family transcriptional regulator
VAQFDEIIHQPVRLRLMAALMTLDEKTRISFNTLKEVLQVTDGNLSVHISRLEEAGYVLVEKTFVNKKPYTYIAVTPRGRSAFSEHIEALQKLLQIRLPVVQESAPRAAEGTQDAPSS